jgi:hypothetical protein
MCPHTTICVLILLYVSSYYSATCIGSVCESWARARQHTQTSAYAYVSISRRQPTHMSAYPDVSIRICQHTQSSAYAYVSICQHTWIDSVCQSWARAHDPEMAASFFFKEDEDTYIASAYYYVSSYYCMCPHTTLSVLILLYVSSYYSFCPL